MRRCGALLSAAAGAVTMIGLLLPTLLLLAAYAGSARPGLDAIGWLDVLVSAAHLLRGARYGEPLSRGRYAVLRAALPLAHVSQAFTTTILFASALSLSPSCSASSA